MRMNKSISGAKFPRTNNPELLQMYATKGIYLNPDEPAILPHPQKEMSINGMAMDAAYDGFGVASNGVPYQFLVEYTKKPIDQLLNKRAYNQIGSEYQMGNFATQSVELATQSLVGSVSSYGDYSSDPISDINLNWVRRDAYRFETVIQYGDLEVDALSQAKIDAVGGKRYSAAQAIAVALNKLFFFGNSASSGAAITQCYGLLNDPALNPAVAVTGGTWSSRTDATTIIKDINGMFASLETQLSNNITQISNLLLVMPGQVGAYLGTVTSLGIPVMQMLKNIYPNIEVVYAPEYNLSATGGTPFTVASNYVQMIAMDVISEKSVVDIFAYKYRSHGTVRQLSSYQEKVSASSFGAGILLPAAISTIYGV